MTLLRPFGGVLTRLQTHMVISPKVSECVTHNTPQHVGWVDCDGINVMQEVKCYFRLLSI
jgi:ABC-type Zn2+ transport system substrate-binding protein/surface adhesin